MPVIGTATLDEAADLFLADVRRWVYAAIERYAGKQPTDVHDQLTYTTGWEPYLRVCHDEHVLRFLSLARDDTAAHFSRSGEWRHGYWRMQEAHHGTEHFELFLGLMTRVAPGDAVTVGQLVDAVEHLGNWNSDVPEWFDYKSGLFRSLFFGADGVRADKRQLNMPDHLRCANLLLLAHGATGESHYLDLAVAYSQCWAAAISDPEYPLPAGIADDGVVYELSGAGEGAYRSFAGMAGRLDDDLDRAENILASGGVQLFLRLWQHGHRTVFLDAATRLVTVLARALEDPDAGAVADAIRCYRRVTGRRDFDDHVMRVVRRLDPYGIGTIGLSMPPAAERRPAGVGKRSDQLAWYENNRPRRHSPMLLSLAAEIEDDLDLARCALEVARTYLDLAVRLLPDGRDHGCAARTVSAVARGHGRDNHAGMTTAVLWPMLQHFGLRVGKASDVPN